MDRSASREVGEVAGIALGRIALPRRTGRDGSAACERGGPPCDFETAASLAQVGWAALLTLPALMVASVALQAPLAGAAVISLGYLGSGRALASRDARSAAAWNAAVLSGLLAWIIVVFSVADGPLSTAGLLSALLAPAFAAGPAVLHHWRGARRGAAPCDREPAERAAEVGPAFQRAAAGAAQSPRGAEHGPRNTAQAEGEREPSSSDGEGSPRICDVAEAIAFALRHAAGKAAGNNVVFVAECTCDVAAQCDQQVGRRILHLMTELAVARSRTGGTVRILAKAVRGAVLLRATTEAEGDSRARAAPNADLSAVAALSQTVEDAGGTVLLESSLDLERISVRLPKNQRGGAV